MVRIDLVRIQDSRAIIDAPTDTVPVGVVQTVVRAGVACITGSIGIKILLAWVWQGWTIVQPAEIRLESRIAEPVTVGVGTGVARVADAVVVRVGLIAVRNARTVVGSAGVRRESRIAESVAVGVGAGVARVAEVVVIGILLARVRGGGAVVGGVGHVANNCERGQYDQSKSHSGILKFDHHLLPFGSRSLTLKVLTRLHQTSGSQKIHSPFARGCLLSTHKQLAHLDK